MADSDPNTTNQNLGFWGGIGKFIVGLTGDQIVKLAVVVFIATMIWKDYTGGNVWKEINNLQIKSNESMHAKTIDQTEKNRHAVVEVGVAVGRLDSTVQRLETRLTASEIDRREIRDVLEDLKSAINELRRKLPPVEAIQFAPHPPLFDIAPLPRPVIGG